MTIRSLRHLKKLEGKTIFLRVDFNVPMQGGKILNSDRIIDSLPTINFLLDKRAKIVIASHLGEPVNGSEKKYSLRPVAKKLAKLLKQPVAFSPDCRGAIAAAAISKLKPSAVLMLENLRFYQGEYDNDAEFAESLAAGTDIYINEAFSVSHRRQASVAAIKDFLPAYAGLRLEQEVKALSKVAQPVKPLVIVMGGAKLSTKAPLIAKLYKKVSHILIGGALANDFLSVSNIEIGRSLTENAQDPFGQKKLRPLIKKLFKGKKLAAKILLPTDVVVKDKSGQPRLRPVGEVKKTDSILDIGPETIARYAAIIKSARTLAWNGPMGKFEEKSYRHGTLAIAALIAARSSGRAYGVVGGGETIEALQLTKMAEYVDWVSTAGGAMLTYLGGGPMPGLKGIVKI